MFASSQVTSDPYHSRGEAEELAARQDPVAWGDAPGPWTQAQVAQYDRDGYRFAESLLPEEQAELFLDEARRMAQSDRHASHVIHEPGGDAVRSIFQVHRHSQAFRQLTRDSRLADVARQLLGGEVYIHQSRINFKPAFDGKEFFWHSDFETWHVEDGMPRMRAVSLSLNLTPSNPFNGPLMVIPQSQRTYVRCVGRAPKDHYKQSLKKQEYGVPSRQAIQQLVERGGIQAPTGPAGSAVFFECNTMHASAGNLSPYPRTNLFLVFNSVENRLDEPADGVPRRPEFLAERDVLPVSEY